MASAYLTRASSIKSAKAAAARHQSGKELTCPLGGVLDTAAVLRAFDRSRNSHQPRTALWMWPNVLSLDAVLIALIWQQLFADACAIRPAMVERISLGVAVWLIYLLDRILDGRRSEGVQTARHRFYQRKLRWSAGAVAAAMLTECAIICRLQLPVLRAGALLSLAIAAYFACVHWPPRESERLPKEALVAALFSTGTALVAWSRTKGTGSLLLALVLFALVCLLNCSAIESYELPKSRILWPARHLRSIALSIAVLSLCLMYALPARELFGAVAIAALGLIWFDRSRSALSSDQIRVAADVPLALPIVLVLARAHGL